MCLDQPSNPSIRNTNDLLGRTPKQKMNNKTKIFIEKLRSSGLRPTKQRVDISKFLFNRKTTFHFTVEDLKNSMNQRRAKKISTATFYNTVHALKSAGHLKEFSLENNTSCYDTNITSHHHFFDNGKVTDITVSYTHLTLPTICSV